MLSDSPLGAAMKDGGAIAFRFKGAVKSGIEMDAGSDEEEDEDGDGGWDVLLPSFEDEGEGLGA